MRLIFTLMLVVSFANADELECDGCIDADDIRGQAVTTQKIRKGAVTEGKLAVDVQRKLTGLVVTDGVGRQLPIEIGEITAELARGYYRLEDGEVVPVSIERRVYGQPHQIYGPSLSYEVVGSTVRSVSTVFFTGAGCTGLSYVVGLEPAGIELLLPVIVVADSAAPNRSRKVFRIGERIDEQLIPLSHLHDVYGCSEADPNSPHPHFPYLTDNDWSRIILGNGNPLEPLFYRAALSGSFRWVPPLSISAP